MAYIAAQQIRIRGTRGRVGNRTIIAGAAHPSVPFGLLER
jgi:hypothetical protein